MRVTLRIMAPRAGEHKETAFYRVHMETAQRSAWRDFRGKRAKSRADAFADRWWRRMVDGKRRVGTARVTVDRVTKDQWWLL